MFAFSTTVWGSGLAFQLITIKGMDLIILVMGHIFG